jgi:cytosine/adenosine deaminase-related metal-dependent hydrolase
MEKKQKGFKKKIDGGRRVNVYLDQATIDEAKKLGLGSISEGLRVAVAVCKTNNLGQDTTK